MSDQPTEQPPERPISERAGIVRRPYVKRTGTKRAYTRRTAEDAAPTRPTPAEPAPRLREDDEPVRRVSRAERQTQRFQLPEHLKKPGWDYEWKTIKIYNEPVDAAVLQEVREAGWRPEKARDWRDLIGPDVPDDAAIESYGLRLYGRPKHLSVQARQEDYEAAEQQQRARMESAYEGRSAQRGEQTLADMGRVVRPVPLGLSIEGEVGVHQK